MSEAARTAGGGIRPAEVLRLALLWLGVAAFFAANIWDTFWHGAPTALVGFAAFPVVGAWILTSRPRNGVGWLLYVIGLFWMINGAVLNREVLGYLPPWVESIGLGISWPAWTFLPLIGAVFPTGRFETRLGRGAAGIVLGYSVLGGFASIFSAQPMPLTGGLNPLGFAELQPASQLILGPAGIVVFLIGIVGIVVDVAMRWRRSLGAERLQYRWLFFGLALTVLVVSTSGLLNVAFGDQSWVRVFSDVASLSTNLIPVAILIAVTRHGLYSIGRVVSRTVTYAIAIALAVGVYAGLVIGLTALIPGLPSVGVALATLAAAAVFLPVLRWTQHRLDRAFDRERYNAEQVVEAFGERLRVEPDPSMASAELVHAVEKTLQPTAVGLWTNGGRG